MDRDTPESAAALVEEQFGAALARMNDAQFSRFVDWAVADLRAHGERIGGDGEGNGRPDQNRA